MNLHKLGSIQIFNTLYNSDIVFLDIAPLSVHFVLQYSEVRGRHASYSLKRLLTRMAHIKHTCQKS